MSGSDFIDREKLKLRLDKFAPGMSDHITPIKYEILTPDLAAFLFRTTDPAGNDHYFVFLEFDYLPDQDAATKLIEDWHGSDVLEYLPAQPNNDFPNQEDENDGIYSYLLAMVARPVGKGYWASNFVIWPGDKINEKIAHLTDKQQAIILKQLPAILKKKPAKDTASFLDSYKTKQSPENHIKDGVNVSDTAVSVYVKPDGHLEFFFNYV